LAAGAASAGVGWVTRVPDPLAAPLPKTGGVEKKETIAKQYFFALTLKDSIEAWQAVVDFPPDKSSHLFRYYAKQQLATLYLAKRRFPEAQEIFDEFAELGRAEPQFR